MDAAKLHPDCVLIIVEIKLVPDMSAPGADLAEFAEANSVGLTRFAYLLCADRSLAEDLVQDALVAMYRRFGDRLPIAAPIAYARKAIVNGHVSRRRRRSAAEVVTAEPPDRLTEEVDHGEQDAMWRLLATLPDRQRAVLVLRYYVDLPDQEIAAALGCRPGTVRSLAARAFTALREHPTLADKEGPR